MKITEISSLVSPYYGDPELIFEVLSQIASKVPSLPHDELTPENEIKGCSSRLWATEKGIMSGSIMTRTLSAIVWICEDCEDIQQVLECIGIEDISTRRIEMLEILIKKIRPKK